MSSPRVVAVARDAEHRFSKEVVDVITLVVGSGVEGDAHSGATVKHRSRVRRDPSQPNLRQVHLIHAELFAQAAEQGLRLAPGELGENITTQEVPLLDLPTGTVLTFGDPESGASVRLTGLRNPCRQINDFRPGLLRVVVERADRMPSASDPEIGPTGGVVGLDGSPIRRKAGVMAVVERGGEVRAGHPIHVTIPVGVATPLEAV